MKILNQLLIWAKHQHFQAIMYQMLKIRLIVIKGQFVKEIR